jgi:GNAT superfamily N-acetyltransferase
MIIRDATRADAPRIAELSGVLGYPNSTAAIAERLKRLLARTGDLVLVADQLPPVMGWVHAAEQELLDSGRRCEILGLVVAAEVRGRGVGRQLVAAVEEWASQRGLNQLAVRSNIVRAESHPFYEQLGFVKLKTQHAYRKQLP